MVEAHAAAWGEENHEAAGYRLRVTQQLAGKNLNEQEKGRFRQRAIKRAREYVNEHVRTGTIPAKDVQGIMASVQMKIDAHLAQT